MRINSSVQVLILAGAGAMLSPNCFTWNNFRYLLQNEGNPEVPSIVLAAQKPEARVAALDWMTGDWEIAGWMHIEEHWTRPEGGTLIGMGRTVRGEKTVEFEYLRIEERPDGIYYVAHPFGRPGTDFKLVRFGGTEAVFENPQHDFPTRIIYRKNADGSLSARIEGTSRGQPASREFAYQRMK